jgi:hypothetical protein
LPIHPRFHGIDPFARVVDNRILRGNGGGSLDLFLYGLAGAALVAAITAGFYRLISRVVDLVLYGGAAPDTFRSAPLDR